MMTKNHLNILNIISLYEIIIIMNQSDIKAKTLQTLDKIRELLQQRKYYEYGQKIKLLGHRKLQSKKQEQAAMLFLHGAIALFSIEQVQQNIAIQLMQNLVQILISKPALFSNQYEIQIIKMLQVKPISQKKLDIIKSLVFQTGQPSQHLAISKFYLNYQSEHENYASVERLAASLDQQISLKFIKQWVSHSEIVKNQIPAIWCRIVLWRGLLHGVGAAQELFKTVSNLFNDQPYTIFTGFLLKTLRLNSKEAYSIIGRSYQEFLKSDHFFSELYLNYGQKYFGIGKAKTGILSLIQ